jgi:hypothetical protein
MASDRDTLAELLASRRRCCPSPGRAAADADYLIERGWRPPAQVIESAEEWEAVPPGAVVVTTRGHGRAWVRLETGNWTNGPSCYATKTLLRAHGPRATVVWSPTEKAGTDG